MSGDGDDEVIFHKKSPTPSSSRGRAPSASPTNPSTTARSPNPTPAPAPTVPSRDDGDRSKRRSSIAQKSPTNLPPQIIDIQVSCRNLSSNSSVVALFEAKGNKSLEYVGHTEGIRHSHHPDYQTHLLIEHRKGTGQKVKFNAYSL